MPRERLPAATLSPSSLRHSGHGVVSNCLHSGRVTRYACPGVLLQIRVSARPWSKIVFSGRHSSRVWRQSMVWLYWRMTRPDLARPSAKRFNGVSEDLTPDSNMPNTVSYNSDSSVAYADQSNTLRLDFFVREKLRKSSTAGFRLGTHLISACIGGDTGSTDNNNVWTDLPVRYNSKGNDSSVYCISKRTPSSKP